jgi:hypothetical protein
LQRRKIKSVAVCVLPGKELSFASEVTLEHHSLMWEHLRFASTITYKTAIFRQINKGKEIAHHDALEFPNGRVVLLTLLAEGQKATVLQLPVTAVEIEAPQEAASIEKPCFGGLTCFGQS